MDFGIRIYHVELLLRAHVLRRAFLHVYIFHLEFLVGVSMCYDKVSVCRYITLKFF